jgi:hypothetical protein
MNTYNGWANRPTWTVALWIDSDCTKYFYWTEHARKLNRHQLEQELRDHFTDSCNPLIDEASVYADLLGWALSQVDWGEIAEHLREDSHA